MKKSRLKEPDFEFHINTSNLSDMVGKTHFTTELTLMKCVSGSAVIAIDSRRHIFAANHSFLLSDLVVFQVLEITEDFSVISCTLSLPFYYELAAGFNSNVFSVLPYSAPDLYREEQLRSADLLFENLCLLYENREHSNRRIMAMNLVICYMYEMYELTSPLVQTQMEEDQNNHYNRTVNSFYDLAVIHSEKNRSIEFYAGLLNMSSRYLYKIVQTSIHITPKQFIDDVVISSVKRLLLTTTLSNQQIADRFNFPDQSSFGQYFKRCTGISPSAFRDKYE